MKTVFSPEQLNQIVQDTLPTDVTPGEKVLVGAVDQHGVKVVAAFTWKGDLNWELQAAVQHDWDGDTKAGGKVILRWP